MSKHRVGIVGAGHISHFHVSALRRIRGVDVVGVHDQDEARAVALARPLGLQVAPSLDALIAAGATSIHVLTPPETHAPIALAAIERGCHVFVEKPLATDVSDAERVRDAASAHGVSVGVGHSLLFDPHVRKALADVRAGALGDLVSVDILRSSVYPTYEGGPLLSHQRSAGNPFRDLGVHALYLMEAFLGPIDHVDACWSSLGGDSSLAFDEWRTIARCQRGVGQFQLSWNVKPLQHQIVLQGTKGVRRVDLFLMFESHRRGLPLPKSAERVVNAVTDALGPLVDVPRNVAAFAMGRLRQYHGVQDLIAAFYASIDAGAPPPVEVQSGISAVRWTEEVARAADSDFESRRSRLSLVATHPARRPVLVTGASGGLGSRLVERLRADGDPLRIFCRRAPAEVMPGVEIVLGDLGDRDAVDRAVRGARLVIHLGAAMKGGLQAHQCATVAGTRNVVDACLDGGVEKLVHVSSLSVVDWAGGGPFAIVDEDSELEPRADERGAYTRSKLEAERIVAQAVAERTLPAVILRPGQIFGGKLPLLTPAVARQLPGNRWFVLGDGKIPLPLVYVDDVVDALVLAARSDLRAGEIIQLVDPDSLTQNEVLELVAPGELVIRVPRRVVFAGGTLSTLALGALGKRSPLSTYRLRSALALRRFESGRAQRMLGWSPRVGVREGIRRGVASRAA